MLQSFMRANHTSFLDISADLLMVSEEVPRLIMNVDQLVVSLHIISVLACVPGETRIFDPPNG